MNKLSIVACIKNEGRYLKEWLDFHLLGGVEHFYLYDNVSNDNTCIVLEPYVAKGLVSYFYVDMDMCQFACYYNALTAFRDQTEWMAFIDADEFLFSPKGSLATNLDKYKQYPGIVVNEVFFGSNGHIDRPKGLVIENYTKREEKLNLHVKSICQPSRTLCPANNPHTFLYFGGTGVTENGVPSTEPLTPTHSSDVFRIHHYWVKSKEDYEGKIRRGRADVPKRDPNFRYSTGIGRTVENVITLDNEVEDKILLPYAARLKNETQN